MSISEVNIIPCNLMVFVFLQLYCLYEHHNTTNNFLRAEFSSVCNKYFLSHLRLFKKIITIWTTRTGREMTSRLIRWPLLESVIVR